MAPLTMFLPLKILCLMSIKMKMKITELKKKNPLMSNEDKGYHNLLNS